MRQNTRFFVGMILFTLLVGGGLSGSVLASGGERIDPADLQAITPETLILQESADGLTWTPIIGDLGDGYSMVLDPAKDYLVDIEMLEADPVLADDWYGIDFDDFRAPDGFFEYWAGEGIDENSTGDAEKMWQIINGELPMFYIKASGGTYSLVDGYLYAIDAAPESVTTPWQLNGDLPLGTYHFGGWVDSEYLNIQITFTKQATVSLSSESWTIDGCGYLDVYIRLADVHDLYAVDISIKFDETVLEVMDMDDAVGINLQPINTWFNSEYFVYNEADNSGGTIRYVATQQRTTDPVDDEGDIAMIRFRAKDIGSGDITITGAELSDRDGYLVGRPITWDEPAATITTQFTAAGGLDLDIIRLDSANVQLSWPKLAEEEVSEYRLYRSTLPYFDIGDAEVVEMDDTAFVEGTSEITFNDQVLGKVGPADPEIPEPDNNYFYAYGLQVACSNDFASPLSDQVGKIEFELWETNTRDYAWIGLILDNETILDSIDLANNIESHIYSGTINVLTIGEWNLSGQNMTNYNHVNETSKYDVFIKQPYRVEVDIDGTTSGSVIWAQVGKLPEISAGMYTFDETAITDFSWILHPLDKVNIFTSDQLVSDIEVSGEVNVLAIGEWNGTAQNMTNVIPGVSSFNTRFGYPYRVEVQMLIGGPVTWP